MNATSKSSALHSINELIGYVQNAIDPESDLCAEIVACLKESEESNQPCKLVIHLRTEIVSEDGPEKEISIPTSHAEYFNDRVEGWNEKLEHFEIKIVQGDCFEWEGIVYEFCNVLPSSLPIQRVKAPNDNV